MTRIYDKYCNDVQNEAFGAYLIANFIKNYISNSEENQPPTIFHLFVMIPMIMNSSYKKHINFNTRKTDQLIRNIIEDKDIAGSLGKYINKYKEYTMTCLVFALRLGIVEIDSNNISVRTVGKVYDTANLDMKKARKLGELLSKKFLDSFLISLGVYL